MNGYIRLTGYSVFLEVMSLVACMSCFALGLQIFGERSNGIGYREVIGPSRDAVVADVASAMDVTLAQLCILYVCMCVWVFLCVRACVGL